MDRIKRLIRLGQNPPFFLKAPLLHRYLSCIAFTGPVGELEPVTVTQSTTHESDEAAYCIDGDTGGRFCATHNEPSPWIAIDYGTRVIVERVEIFNRNGYGERARNVDVRISDELPTSAEHMFSGGTLLGHFAGPGTDGQHIIISGQKLL